MTLDFVKKVLTIGGEGTPALQFYTRGFNITDGGTEPTWRDIILSGNTALTLVGAKANGLNYVKLFGATEQSNLPSGYTQVEYLQSSGEEYIDLGGTLSTSTDDIEVTLQLTTTSNTMSFVGARTSTTDKNYNIGAYGTSSLWRWGWKGNSDAVPDVAIDTNKHTFYIDHTNQTLSIDGVVAETRVISGNITTPTTPILFGIHATSATILYLSPVRIYGFKKWRSGELAQHLVPCRRKSDNELGMYDFVTGTFFTNQGTGTFTAGDDVTPTPTAPINIKCNNGTIKVSPNLFNGTYTEGWGIQGGAGSIIRASGRYSFYIPVTVGKTYTITRSEKGSSTYFFFGTYADEPYTNNQACVTFGDMGASELSYSVTIPDGANYLAFFFGTGTSSNVQVEQGSTATTYMPYGKIYTDGTVETVTDELNNTATAEMLLKVKTYQDIQEVLSGAVTRNIGIVVLDGTEDWNKSNTYAGSFYVNSYTLSGGNKLANYTNVYCTHGFKTDNLTQYSSASVGAIYWANTNLNIKFDDGTATVVQFKQWLADQYANGTPVILVYPLATSTTETVTGQTLTTQAGTNTITATGYLDNLGLEVSYKGT